MERRYELRLEQMLAQAEVSPELMRGLLKRLEVFVEPFSKSLHQPEQGRHAAEYMTGLLSKLDRQTARRSPTSTTRQRQGLQKFVGVVPWDHTPLLATPARQVGEGLGEADGVIVFDPSAFAKKGPRVSASAAVVRPARQGGQLPGRRFMAYVAEGAGAGQYTSVPPQGLGQRPRPAQGGGRAQGGEVPHPPPTRPGDARRVWSTPAALLGRRGRRDGPPFEFSPGIAGAKPAFLGRPVEHAGPRPGRAAAAVLGARAPSHEPVLAARSLARALPEGAGPGSTCETVRKGLSSSRS